MKDFLHFVFTSQDLRPWVVAAILILPAPLTWWALSERKQKQQAKRMRCGIDTPYTV